MTAYTAQEIREAALFRCSELYEQERGVFESIDELMADIMTEASFETAVS